MKQTLDKLVTDILRHLEDHPEFALSENGIRSWLNGQGYKKRDIEAALKMLRPQVRAVPTITRKSPGAIRHLSAYEAYKLSPEARDALVRLELYELITPYEREMLLERLNQVEGEVGMDDLDYMLSWLLCTMRDVESQQTIYSVFEGSREALN